MLPTTRPLVEGMYECRFDGDVELTLKWDGRGFCLGDGRMVRCTTLTSWRGAWE